MYPIETVLNDPRASLESAIGLSSVRSVPLRNCSALTLVVAALALVLALFGHYREAAWLASVSAVTACAARILWLRVMEPMAPQYLRAVEAADWSMPARAVLDDARHDAQAIRWLDLRAAAQAEARFAVGQALLRARVEASLQHQRAALRASQLAYALSGADISAFGRAAR